MELDVLVYEKDKVPCRLIIEPVDDNEYCRRLEKARMSPKSRGVGITELYKMRLRYNVTHHLTHLILFNFRPILR